MNIFLISALALFSCFLPGLHSLQASETFNDQGFIIKSGAGGDFILTYPKLLNQEDKALAPDKVTHDPDGKGVTLTYGTSGKLRVTKKSGNAWSFHFTDLAEDRVKLSFGIDFPLRVTTNDSSWTVDNGDLKPFPKTKDKEVLYEGHPPSFSYAKDPLGFLLVYPDKTRVRMLDLRVQGKDYFQLAHVYDFPGKADAKELIYSLTIVDDRPDT